LQAQFGFPHWLRAVDTLPGKTGQSKTMERFMILMYIYIRISIRSTGRWLWEGEMRARGGASAGTASWIDRELAGCKFTDVRLGKRFKMLVERLAEGVGGEYPDGLSGLGRHEGRVSLLRE
jgi:hypothetical protein